MARSQVYGLANSRPFKSFSPVSNLFSLFQPLTTRPIKLYPLCARGDPKLAGASIAMFFIGTVSGLKFFATQARMTKPPVLWTTASTDPGFVGSFSLAQA